MKSLKELCCDIVYKKCNFKMNLNQKWLNCGMRCLPFKFYQKNWQEEFWYCDCKTKTFTITKPDNNKFLYKKHGKSKNCFYCWFLLMVKTKVEIIYKYKNKLPHLASLLIKFFQFINEYKYIYQQPNYQNMEFDYYESFPDYFDENLSCLCYEN